MIRSSPLPCLGTVASAPPAECPDKRAPCRRLPFQVGQTTECSCSPRVKMSCKCLCVSVFVCSVFLLHLTNSLALLLQLPPRVQLASLSLSSHSRCLSLTGVSALCLRMPRDVFSPRLHLSLLLISFHMCIPFILPHSCFIILYVPLHFHFVSAPPSSLPPSFPPLIGLHVSVIFLLLPRCSPPSQTLLLSHLSSPVSSSSDRYHSSLHSAGLCLCVDYLLSHLQKRTHCTEQYITLPVRRVRVWI